MIGVIGVCQTALVYVVERASVLCTASDLTWQLVDDTHKTKKKRNVLFYPCYETFVHDLYQQRAIKGVAVVFDTPEKLKRISPITFVEDIAEYSPEPMDVQTLFNAIQQMRDDNREVTVTVKTIDPLKALVLDQQRGKILHHYNRVVYSLSGGKRETLTRVLLRYLFGDLTRAKFLDEVQPLIGRGKLSDHFQLLWTFMETEEGQALQRALREIKRRRFSPNTNYAQLKATHGADEFEMQFLAMAYCKTVKGHQKST